MPHETQKCERPAATGRGDRKTIGGPLDYAALAGSRPDTYAASRPAAQTDPVSVLLSRLDHVRQYGKGWRADCPVGHSSRGSLSIASGDDGRVLLRCFACDGVAPILAALGISLADLFPQRDHRNLPPMERARIRELAGVSRWKAALGVLAREATVVEVAAAMFLRGDPLIAEDFERVRVASQRIHDAQEVLR